MKRYEVLLVVGIITLTILTAGCCGDRKKTENLSSANFLPKKISSLAMERSSKIRTFTGELLYEYIDGGAEIFHLYNFIEVATADYKYNETEIVVDIYRFDNAIDAYGLFTMLRPDNPEVVHFGVEGFASVLSLDFVKGSFLVRLIGYDESAEIALALRNLAKEFNELIPGTTRRPEIFSLFPLNNKIGASDKYYAESFLGQMFLTCVYSQDYLLGSDTLTLFLTGDGSGDKFLEWSMLAVKDTTSEKTLKGLLYDEGKVFIIIDSYHGKIIAGLKSGKLLGIVNYNEKHKAFLIEWLNSLL